MGTTILTHVPIDTPIQKPPIYVTMEYIKYRSMAVLKERKQETTRAKFWGRAFLVLGCIALLGASSLFFGTRAILYQAQEITGDISSARSTSTVPAKPDPFPLGVNPMREEITENPAVEGFFAEHVTETPLVARSHTGWFGQTFAKLTQMDWYQNLASPTGRVLVIQSGERKEEVASHFGKILGWNDAMKKEFLNGVTTTAPEISEGKFLAATYVTGRDATPADLSTLVNDKFEKEVVSRYSKDIESVVPLKDALIIASMLEREAYDFEDMRYISGVIWNRLFVGMNLQIDATLQYAKGTKSVSHWWPRVVPSDKNIASPFNTYKNEGLPPEPIASPSLDAILAALNPRKTDCIFYFHDKDGGFHCTVTYEEHVKLLKQYYGRGK